MNNIKEWYYRTLVLFSTQSRQGVTLMWLFMLAAPKDPPQRKAIVAVPRGLNKREHWSSCWWATLLTLAWSWLQRGTASLSWVVLGEGKFKRIDKLLWLHATHPQNSTVASVVALSSFVQRLGAKAKAPVAMLDNCIVNLVVQASRIDVLDGLNEAPCATIGTHRLALLALTSHRGGVPVASSDPSHEGWNEELLPSQGRQMAISGVTPALQFLRRGRVVFSTKRFSTTFLCGWGDAAKAATEVPCVVKPSLL